MRYRLFAGMEFVAVAVPGLAVLPFGIDYGLGMIGMVVLLAIVFTAVSIAIFPSWRDYFRALAVESVPSLPGFGRGIIAKFAASNVILSVIIGAIALWFWLTG